MLACAGGVSEGASAAVATAAASVAITTRNGSVRLRSSTRELLEARDGAEEVSTRGRCDRAWERGRRAGRAGEAGDLPTALLPDEAHRFGRPRLLRIDGRPAADHADTPDRDSGA